MAEFDETQVRIIRSAMKMFNEHGIKFTMDDVAADLTMSKKTIYKIFSSKEALVEAAVEYGFGAVKDKEAAYINDPDLDIVDKIRHTIIAMPDDFVGIDWRRLHEFADPFPKAYASIRRHIETGWDGTIALLQEGMRQGRIKPVNIPVLKSMIESSIEGFFKDELLIDEGIAYGDALQDMIDIIIDGIRL